MPTITTFGKPTTGSKPGSLKNCLYVPIVGKRYSKKTLFISMKFGCVMSVLILIGGQQKGDVFAGDFIKYQGFDLLIGGSPCTYWSIAQKPDAREKTSSGLGWELFSQYVRALKESNCKYFLYENNASMSPDIKAEITQKLCVEPIMIDSALLSAQSRKRLYWTNIPGVTQPENKGHSVIDILCPNVEEVNYIDKAVFNGKENSTTKSNNTLRVGHINKGRQGERIYSVYGKTVTMMAGAGGLGAKTGLYLVGDVVRKLTVIEAERAQTIPDNYTEGIPVSHRYKAVGNGWTVDVIVHVLKGIS